MGEDILNKVIAAEREIQRRLELERTSAREWVDKAKNEQERKLLEEDEKIKEKFSVSFGKAVKDAESRASTMLEEASAEAVRLENLDDEFLTRIIMKHIVRILPEQAP